MSTLPRLPQSLPARALLGVSLVVGLVMRVRLVFSDDGIYWPDEIYQSFEPAHKLVFGYGVIPWEFIQGARTWALPGLVAAVLKVTALLGGDTPNAYVPAVKLVFVAASVATAYGVYRLSQLLSADALTPTAELASAAAASLWALCSVALYFAPRAMSENASSAAIVWGLVWVLSPTSSRRLVVAGASLLGLAVLFRLQSVVFCVGVLIMLLQRALAAKRASAPVDSTWKTALVTLLAWALGYGLLDAATWHDAPGARVGGLFHSVVVYVKFNLIEGQGARWGTAPWQYYAEHLWSAMPAVTCVFAVASVVALAQPRTRGLMVTSLAFVAIHAAVAHKEYRFLLPVLPVVCALVGPAVVTVSRVPALRFTALATAAVAAWSASSAPALTMGDLGAYPERPRSSAWGDFANVNRLMKIAGQRPDLCGLRIDIVHLAWTGGSTYVHRRVPLYMPGTPVNGGHFNYAIVWPGSGGEVIAQDSGIELVRIPNAACTPDPSYSWRLP